MIYKEFQGIKLPRLGLGTMRLPTTDEEYSHVDEEATEKLIAYAMENGVNYFDTGWLYHWGKAEPALGRILKKYPRESFYLADKFPGYDLTKIASVEPIFEKQLQRCDMEYFDFYLFHNVCEVNIEHYLNPAYGIFDYLMKQKQNGRIKYLGFSAHGNLQTIGRFLEAYGKDMDFCQLQINWLDWEFQSAREKVELVRSYGLPIWVMEPLRGGKLVNVDLGETFKDKSAVEVGFRFLQGIEDVQMVLSGMSNFEQLKNNIEIFATEQPLTGEERNALFAKGKAMTEKLVPCTACRYCTVKCPKGLDIPRLIELYNEDMFSSDAFMAPWVISTFAEDKKPSACLGCGACEKVCPQNIKISKELKSFNERLKR